MLLFQDKNYTAPGTRDLLNPLMLNSMHPSSGLPLAMALHPIWREHANIQKLPFFWTVCKKALPRLAPWLSFCMCSSLTESLLVDIFFCRYFLFIQTGCGPGLLTCLSLFLLGVTLQISTSLHYWFYSWLVNGKSHFPLFLRKVRSYSFLTTNKHTETFILILGLTCTQSHMKKLGCISTLCSSFIKLYGVLLESYSMRLSFLSYGNNF